MAEQRKVRRLKKRTIALAVLLSLVVAELVLDVASWRVTGQLDARPSPEGVGLRVLCMGDSWTYGVGAPKGEAYPDYLGRILGTGYVVINEGRPGMNSSQLAARLPALLEKHHPDYVVVMVGMNNKHNTVGGSYRELIAAGYINPSPFHQALESVDRFMWNSALYRLVRWSAARPEQGQLAFEKLPLAPAVEPSASQPGNVGAQTGEAIHYMEKAHEAELRGDTVNAVAALREAFSRVSDSPQIHEPLMNHVVWAKGNAKEEDFAALMALLQKNLPPEAFQSQVADPLLLSENHSVGEKMLWFDLARVHEDTRKAHAQLILLAYPKGDERETMAAFGSVHRVPFVDTVTFLPGALLKSSNIFTEYGRLTGHGNELLAAYFVEAARRQGLLPVRAPSSEPVKAETPTEPVVETRPGCNPSGCNSLSLVGDPVPVFALTGDAPLPPPAPADGLPVGIYVLEAARQYVVAPGGKEGPSGETERVTLSIQSAAGGLTLTSVTQDAHCAETRQSYRLQVEGNTVALSRSCPPCPPDDAACARSLKLNYAWSEGRLTLSNAASGARVFRAISTGDAGP